MTFIEALGVCEQGGICVRWEVHQVQGYKLRMPVYMYVHTRPDKVLSFEVLTDCFMGHDSRHNVTTNDRTATDWESMVKDK